EGGYRAAGAEQPDAILLLGQHFREARKGVPRTLAHPFVGCDPVGTFERLPALAFGQRHDTPRRAPPGADPGDALLLVDQDELRRPATDIEDERGAVARLQQ